MSNAFYEDGYLEKFIKFVKANVALGNNLMSVKITRASRE